ncbi:hypothetical protein [Paraburkholderia hospita]|uniref:hypothetical protein n=1 Tax=Paraburkholderia hospita TaxID=169430 RepID=UPI003ECD2976
MDFTILTDADLDDMRLTAKTFANPGARWVTKGAHKERNFQLWANRDDMEKYRVFARISVTRDSVFSVGLVRTYPSGESLILVRYNGGYHAHRNIIERNKVPAVCHKHVATARYIAAGLDADGYAEAIDDYNSVEGAFACLLRDCGIQMTVPASSIDMSVPQTSFNFDI